MIAEILEAVYRKLFSDSFVEVQRTDFGLDSANPEEETPESKGVSVLQRML